MEQIIIISWKVILDMEERVLTWKKIANVHEKKLILGRK